LPPPILSNVLIAPNKGSLVLTVQALALQPWILQESPDLNHWLDLVTNNATPSGIVLFTNTIGNATHEFYRVRSP